MVLFGQTQSVNRNLIMRFGGALACAGLVLTLACKGGGGAPAGEINIRAVPRKVEITAGKEVSLGFLVTGTKDRTVKWSIVETGGGEISASGVYKAPLQEGLYHAMVQSQATRPWTRSRSTCIPDPWR